MPCRGALTNCSSQVGAAYRALRSEVAEGDLVISTNPFVANYYLGRIDGWLVQQQTPSGPTPFEGSTTDEYFGIPIIDTESELLDLELDARRVWVLIDYDTKIDSSMLALLTSSFSKHAESGALAVYVGSATE